MECDQNISAIHRKLYELLAAMIRGNRKNCSEFATEKWLKVFIDHLSLPRFTHDVLEVIQCLLTDSPEVLNIITKDHIQVGFWSVFDLPTMYMYIYTYMLPMGGFSLSNNIYTVYICFYTPH